MSRYNIALKIHDGNRIVQNFMGQVQDLLQRKPESRRMGHLVFPCAVEIKCGEQPVQQVLEICLEEKDIVLPVDNNIRLVVPFIRDIIRRLPPGT